MNIPRTYTNPAILRDVAETTAAELRAAASNLRALAESANPLMVADLTDDNVGKFAARMSADRVTDVARRMSRQMQEVANTADAFADAMRDMQRQPDRSAALRSDS